MECLRNGSSAFCYITCRMTEVDNKNVIHSNIFVSQQRQYGTLNISLWGTSYCEETWFSDLFTHFLFLPLCNLAPDTDRCVNHEHETQRLHQRDVVHCSLNHITGMNKNSVSILHKSSVSLSPFVPSERPLWQQRACRQQTTRRLYQKHNSSTQKNRDMYTFEWNKHLKLLVSITASIVCTFFIWLLRDSLTLNIATFFTQK